jgi:beta-N-acetylhexosaminidase
MKRAWFTLLVVALLFTVTGCFAMKGGPNTPSDTENNPNSASPAPAQSPSSVQAALTEIIAAAKEGKVPGVPFVAGKTEINDIVKSWGASQNVSSTKAGIYAAYENHAAVFGYYRHSPVFDVRSDNKQLQNISLKDIKQAMGDPEQTTDYDSANVHQQILTYSLGNEQLRWVMDKPDKMNPNPAVDHISVYNQEIANNSIDTRINQMSLDEKIGQMLMVGIDGTTPGNDAETMIKQACVGGIILYGSNIQSLSQTVQLTNELKKLNAEAHHPEPLLISVDEEGGLVDRMPDPFSKMPTEEAVGKVADSQFSYQVGQVLGKEAASLGFNMNYAPVLDVIAHPGESVIGSRALSSDANRVGKLGTEIMNGIQSQKVISVIKHFPGYGSVDVDAHKDLPSVAYGIDQLEQSDWVPYQNAIAHGADAIMVTHLLVPQLDARYPASMSSRIINDMLRNKLGFQGVVMTDDMTMGAIENHYDIKTAAVQAVAAGADIVMVAFHQDQQLAAIQAIKKAVESGTITADRIDDSVYRIIRLKEKYNISDHPIKEPDVTQLNEQIRTVIKRVSG